MAILHSTGFFLGFSPFFRWEAKGHQASGSELHPHPTPQDSGLCLLQWSGCPLGSEFLAQLLRRLGYFKGENKKSQDGLALLPSLHASLLLLASSLWSQFRATQGQTGMMWGEQAWGDCHLCMPAAAVDRAASPNPGQSWVTSPEGLLMSSTWSGWWREEMGWGGGGRPGKGWETCGYGRSQGKPGPQKLYCTADWQTGSQAPTGGPRPVVGWGWYKKAPGGCSFLSNRKSPNPSSACLGSWTTGVGATEPDGQERKGTEASLLPVTSDSSSLKSCPVTRPGGLRSSSPA